MSNILKRIANLPGKLFRSVFRREPDLRDDADRLRYIGGDDGGRETVRVAFAEAAQLLRQKKLITTPRHRIRTIRFVPGSRFTEEKEWGFFDAANGIFVAGLSGGREIQLAVSPDTGAMNRRRGHRDARHEWGHAFLAIAHPRTTTEQQHEMMGF